MGLDMYLSKKTYVKNWSHQKPEDQHNVTVIKGDVQRTDIKPERISYVVEEVAYWRKFNALHGWFVDNCGNGEDNCQEMYVDIVQLEELLGILKEVREKLNSSNKVKKVLQDWNGKDYEVEVYDNAYEISELLSPHEGFFFGSYNIDEYYKNDVEETIEVIEGLLSEEGSGDFYYQASW
jgi:hypothetical protein